MPQRSRSLAICFCICLLISSLASLSIPRFAPRQPLPADAIASTLIVEIDPFNADGKPTIGGKTGPDGKTEITCDLPESEKKKNVGGRDGAGLCVFTSIEYAARWQCERTLFNLQSQMRKEPGGGYPDKVDKMLAKYAPGARYGQHTGGDESVLDAVLASGRIACVTYNGFDPHYGQQSIAHMVALVHLDKEWACISDNNFPGDTQFTWMSRGEFLKRWKGGGGGWVVFLLRPPPPPCPKNWRFANG